MPLSSRSHPRTCARIGSVSRGQCHIYQNLTRIHLSLFKESRDDMSFLIWTTRSSRITEDLTEDREKYLVRDTRCRRIFAKICSFQPSSPSINTRNPEELPFRAPDLQISRPPDLTSRCAQGVTRGLVLGSGVSPEDSVISTRIPTDTSFLIQRIQGRYVFPYLDDKIVEDHRDLTENRGKYLARDTRCRRIFARICSSQPPSPSINTRHPEELPSRAPDLQISRPPDLTSRGGISSSAGQNSFTSY
ncbi:hypothetical protein F511_00491 [Dorcoceras hygrometricum]|uniref:Uncharacterized protein n=1 Tax=Dorcoceras hygrometricum TaxID=472368 RepID=A0A2Z7BCD6_9LAMI|nr:hypothetical protein F511_00491 [Dorcoceras hygrometricum]